MHALRIVAVLVLAATADCKFPELPPLEDDGSVDASLDGPPSDSVSGPNVVITAGPTANSTTGPRVTFEFTVQDGSPYCRFDAAQLTPCTSPLTANLAEGIHSFHVQATSSGGVVDSDSRLWSVDCQAVYG